MTDITLFRHTLAALAYRASKAFRGAPPEFADFKASPDTRTPAEILAHMADLFDWALSILSGKQVWHDSKPLAWDEGVARFHAALTAFDDHLMISAEHGFASDGLALKLFQAPIADALTHVGQIAMLRRIAGCPIRGENYFVAEVAAGRVGAEQAPPRREFD